METTLNICFLILLSFQQIFPVLSEKDKRLLLTDPDFTDQQQIYQDIQFLKATVETLKQGSTTQTILAQQQATEISNLKLKLLLREKDQSALETELRKTKLDMELIIQNKLSSSLGSVYIQWGRNSCTRNGTELVYAGLGGGGHYSETGRSSSPVCIPHNPELGHVISGNVGSIYGMEYNSDAFGKNILDKDTPCAVCRATNVTSVLMIPGKLSCNRGWNLEYKGILTTGLWNHHGASTYICVDLKPEVLEGGSQNEDGYVLYPVIAVCGSLRCPPYVQNSMFSCVVCSK